MKPMHLVWKIYRKPTTEGVWILSGLAHWTLPYEIPTPSVEDLIKMLYRGGVAFKWISPLDTSTWNSFTLCGRFNLSVTDGV